MSCSPFLRLNERCTWYFLQQLVLIQLRAKCQRRHGRDTCNMHNRTRRMWICSIFVFQLLIYPSFTSAQMPGDPASHTCRFCICCFFVSTAIYFFPSASRCCCWIAAKRQAKRNINKQNKTGQLMCVVRRYMCLFYYQHFHEETHHMRSFRHINKKILIHVEKRIMQNINKIEILNGFGATATRHMKESSRIWKLIFRCWLA